jgi:poly-beta-hydroxyalkanoate depolymerase
VPLDFTASGPFDHDLAVPIPSVPLLAAAANLADQDPAADATQFLLTALVRQRNQVAFALRQAREAADTATATLRQSLRS